MRRSKGWTDAKCCMKELFSEVQPPTARAVSIRANATMTVESEAFALGPARGTPSMPHGAMPNKAEATFSSAAQESTTIHTTLRKSRDRSRTGLERTVGHTFNELPTADSPRCALSLLVLGYHQRLLTSSRSCFTTVLVVPWCTTSHSQRLR